MLLGRVDEALEIDLQNILLTGLLCGQLLCTDDYLLLKSGYCYQLLHLVVACRCSHKEMLYLFTFR